MSDERIDTQPAEGIAEDDAAAQPGRTQGNGEEPPAIAGRPAGDDEQLHGEVVPALEALLYAAEEPVPIAELAEVMAAVGGEQQRRWAAAVSASLVERAAIALADRLAAAGSALQVLEVAGGLRLGTRPQYDAWIRALRQVERPSRLSVAALETLSVIAYRQPATAAEIAAVRGVDPATSLRTLRDQGLVRITGRKRAVGRPFTYGTTRQFLELFGLRDLDELPDPEEFEELLEG
jgi:segregation and condensation protein B